MPHGVACVSCGIGFFLFFGELAFLEMFLGIRAFKVVGLGWFGLAGIALLDGFSRFQEYRRIKALLVRRGWSERIFLLVSASRCQRDAALAAAKQAGGYYKTKSFFHHLGYRWYHVLPDAIMKNPFLFFSPKFLRVSFLPGKL